MQKSEVKDLTVGSPNEADLKLCGSDAAGISFQQFYNMVDTIIVGKCLGSIVSGGGWIDGIDQLYDHRFLYRCLQRICGSRWRRSSAREITKGMRKFVANAGWLSAVFAVVMTTVVGALCMNILQWMNTPEDIIQGI